MKIRKTKPTLSDVAHLAGVSTVTVSYVINGRKSGPDRISPDTRERVLNAAQILNYVPNQVARDLQRNTTKRICFSIPRLGVPTYDTIAEQIQDAATAQGYHMIVNLSRNTSEEENTIRQVQSGLADGLIMIIENSYHKRLPTLLKMLSQSGIAVVIFDNELEPIHFDVVRNSDLTACYEGVRHLISSGRRRIACLALKDSKGNLHARVNSYYAALKDSHLKLKPELIVSGAATRQLAYLSTKELLALAEPPDAIFACTDVAALSAIRAIQDSGLEVPKDIAVLGAGNIIEGELSRPSLSSIGPDKHDYRGIFEFLMTRLESSKPLAGRELITPWSLKIRDST